VAGHGLEDLRQSGCLRALFPRDPGGDTANGVRAVVLNTPGGLTGGDRLDIRARAGAGARLTLTTQAAGRAYRVADGYGGVSVSLDIAAGGRIDWLPRETILFDRADLRRRFNVPMHGDAHLLAVEPVVFGRLAMGAPLRNSALRDSWRIRRGGAGDGVFYPGVATGRGAA
jgi:urease accessory protein